MVELLQHLFQAIGLVIVINYLYKNLMSFIMLKRINDKFKKNHEEKMELVKKMKENGDFHKWTTITVYGKTYTVCETTGFCPENDTFFDVETVMLLKSSAKNQIEFETYKTEKLNEVLREYGAFVDDESKLEELYGKIMYIKVQHTLDFIETQLKISKKEGKDEQTH